MFKNKITRQGITELQHRGVAIEGICREVEKALVSGVWRLSFSSELYANWPFGSWTTNFFSVFISSPIKWLN